MKIRVGINGFGSIGKRFLRIAAERPEIEVVAINDLTDAATLAHLLKYDSNYGTYDADVASAERQNYRQWARYRCSRPEGPRQHPLGDYGVDIVIESTGVFVTSGRAHLQAGAKKVIISAPAKEEDLTIVLGVNEQDYDPKKHHVISNASCTTNCLAPVAKVLHEEFGIITGLMTTIHAYTNDQRVLDLPHKDLRRARAAALSIIPTTTGAARAVYLVLPELEGRLNGFALRVPTPTVSVVDLVCEVEKPAAAEDVNAVFRHKAQESLKGVLAVSDEPLVSIDFKGNSHSAIVDALSTMSEGNLVKVVAWYDNEWDIRPGWWIWP